MIRFLDTNVHLDVVGVLMVFDPECLSYVRQRSVVTASFGSAKVKAATSLSPSQNSGHVFVGRVDPCRSLNHYDRLCVSGERFVSQHRSRPIREEREMAVDICCLPCCNQHQRDALHICKKIAVTALLITIFSLLINSVIA